MQDSGEFSSRPGEPAALFLVTGAGGHLGGALVRLLARRGARCRGLLLPGEAAPVSGPGLRYITGDVRDTDSLRPLFEGAEPAELTVIHTAARISIDKKMPPDLYDVNVNGPRHILSLCREYGVKRLVHVSSVHAIPELPRGQIIREVSSYAPERVVGGYAKTKAEAAQAVLDAAADGLDAVIVLPSGILGPYNSGTNHLIQMLRQYLDGRLPACVRGGYDFVDVRDAAAGCLLAAEAGRRGESYILSGHYATIAELLAAAGQPRGGREIPALPMALAEAAVPFARLDARLHGRRPLYTRYSLHTLRSNSLFSSEKARRELGYTVRSFRETVEDTAAWLNGAAPPSAL